MRFAIISDLHLEFYSKEFREKLAIFLISQYKEKYDVLLNAGDTWNGHNQPESRAFHDAIRNAGIPYVDVKGNHDFYGEKDWTSCKGIVEFDGIKVAYATLWSDCHGDPIAQMLFPQYLYDATAIHFFNVPDMLKTHEEHKKFVLDAKADIVVTHNPPSMLSVTEAFKNDHLTNKMFIPNMENDVVDSGVKLWVHGHVHSKHDYTLGDTRVVANPLGYPEEIPHPYGYILKTVDIS